MSKTIQKNQVSMLRYWTTRYLLVLCIGLLLIGFLSSYWLRQNSLNNRLNVIQLVAQEIAERVTTMEDPRTVGLFVRRIIDDRTRRLQHQQSPKDIHVSILDVNGRVVFVTGPLLRPAFVVNELISAQTKPMKIDMPGRGKGYLVTSAIQENDKVLGWVAIVQLDGASLSLMNQGFSSLLLMLVAFAIMGWVTIYLLTRRMAEPIKLVSEAAIHIREGNYDIVLPRKVQEKELASLVDSFQEMSNRLHQLERLRTELLAGVTHELKTPVTSISSLLQAVKDEVVSGEQAKEFVDISLKEADRLKRMVADLLDFNAFSTGAVTVQMEVVQLQPLVKEIVNQWQLVQDPAVVQTTVVLPETPLYVSVDLTRLQQIMVNVLNNAAQAIVGNVQHPIGPAAHIEVRITGNPQQEGTVNIEMADQGPGIPLEEQSLIFERFFRGQAKLHRVRGLGLGLPYSRMAARAMGGDLLLSSSSPAGTVFVLRLPV